MRKKYVPSERAVKNPRHFLITLRGERFKVGIGGKVVIQKTPPKRPVVFEEATEEQLRYVREEMGMVKLVDVVEEKTAKRKRRGGRKKNVEHKEEEE